MVYEASDRAAALTLANGGGTFDAATLEPVDLTSGYAVAIENFGKGNGALASQSYVAERLRKAAGYGYATGYIGTWVKVNSVGNSIVFIDRVVVLPDLESALILARALHQLAIFDFAKMEDINVQTHQD